MSTSRRVAVLAGSSIGWREKLMRGIAGYSNERGHWHVYTAPEGTEASLFFSESYRWDGLIVRVIDSREARRVMKLGVPAVSVGSARVALSTLPRVKVNDESLTKLAVTIAAPRSPRNCASRGTAATSTVTLRVSSLRPPGRAASAFSPAGYADCPNPSAS